MIKLPLIMGAAISILLLANCCHDPWAASNDGDRIDRYWKQQEEAVSSALTGITFDEERLIHAGLFFESITGITIRGNGTPFGWLPNQYTKEDLGRVRDWYRYNKGRLCWNERSKVVELCKPKPPSQPKDNKVETSCQMIQVRIYDLQPCAC